MFLLNSRRHYDRYGSQRAEGSFLMLFSGNANLPNGKPEVRALVRYVKMRQIGHFMMGAAIVKSPAAKTENDTVSPFYKTGEYKFYRVADGHYRISLTGTYGNNGLTLSENEYPGLWEQLHPLPEDLALKFWEGGGHNSAGTEAKTVHDWAVENLSMLRRLRK